MLGSVVDSRYELLRLLGTGGMGAVYEALHRGTGRRVAVKLIARQDLADDDEILVRFQREAQVAARVDTVHIVDIIDAGRDRASGLPFIAMELLDGYDVKQLVGATGAVPPDVALRIGAQALSGLQKAHESGIVHRDIKPANIFLARKAEGSVVVKLLDFGIAKLPPDLLDGIEGGTVTVTGKLLGSPLFMSPEQAQGLKTLDHRTDIWSLGAVIYEALVGHAPFSSSSTMGQLIVAICSHPPADLEQLAPWVPPAAARIVRRAMSIDVEKRYPTAAAMLEEVMELLPGGTAMDESVLAGASKRSAVISPRREASRATLLKGSPSPRTVPDDGPRTEVSPQQPIDWDHRGSSGGVRVSQPARPVTVNLSPDPNFAGATLRSSDHPALGDTAKSVAAESTREPQPRRLRRWGTTIGLVAAGVIAILSWRTRRVQPEAGASPSAAPNAVLVNPGGEPTIPTAPAPPPPPAPATEPPALAPATGAIAPATPVPPATAARAPVAPAPSPTNVGASTPVRSPGATRPSHATLAASPPSSASAAPAAATATAMPTVATPAPPSMSSADAGTRRSKFNTLNPDFE